ncbi:MAG: hypothetical protein Q4A79_02590, partial [Candidatus Saccharibacteria bacterium]|nr:hypothetical protein [Candidatus Saccharibacteria bacterium]
MDKDKLHEDNGGGSGLGEFNGPSRRSQETADRLGRVVAKNYDDPKTQIIEGRPLADLVDLDDSERVYGFLSDYWERLGPKLKWELLVAVKKSYAETFGSYKISPFDFVELAESEDWADVDKLRGLADPMATEGNGDGSPQYTIKEIALDAAYVTILKQKDKNEVGFGSIAEDKVLEWIYMDDWFGLFGAASSEDDCFGVKESGPVDDRFNHTDGYFVVKNQHTKNRPLCIAFDITIDPEAVKGKMLEKHCYWFKSEFAQGSNLSEGGYKKETRYVSHSHKHRAGLWLPGFVAAKYFIGFRDEGNDAEVSPGKKFIMPKLVIGCDGDTIGEILQLESQKKKSLLRLRKQSINDITDNDIAKINND